MKNKLLRLVIMASKMVLYGISMQLIFLGILMAADGNAQKIHRISEVKLKLQRNDATVREVFDFIETKTDYHFFYDEGKIEMSKKILLNNRKSSISEILLQVSEQTDLKFRQINEVINVNRKELGAQGIVEVGGATFQARDVSGTVLSGEDNSGLPGVNVIVKGTNSGTVTDVEGNFNLEVPEEDAVLVFSSVGFVSEEVVVGNQSVINITLMPDITALEEIIVVGYGTQRKVNLTGAVAPITADKIQDRPVTQTSTALQGLAPGVVVTQNLGTPGNDEAVIRIRGRGSIGSSNSPLILVDGIQVESIDDINPEDIENISVLKDAASSAIYGSRAANGVILVTTKRAREGKFTVNLDMSYGAQVPTMIPEFVDVREQQLYEDVKRLNGGFDIEWGAAEIQEYRDWIDNNPPNDQYQNNDWYDAVVRGSAPLHREMVSVSGGTDKVKALMSFVNMGQDGLIDNSHFDRRSLRTNIDVKPLKWLGFSTDIFIQRTERKEPAENIGEIFHMVNELEAYRQLYVGDGLWGWAWRGENPKAFVEDGGNLTQKGNYTMLNLNAYIVPAEGWRIDLGYSNLADNNEFKEFTERFAYYEAGANVGDPPQFGGYNPATNSLSMRDVKSLQNYYKATVTYENTFGQHYLKVLAGGDALDQYTGRLTGFGRNFPLGIRYPQLSLADREGLDNSSSETEWALASLLGRVNYSFADKYLLEGSFRYDGSSRFHEDGRYSFFPSVSAGWRISEESFLKGSDFLSDLKLRASWGQLGNQSIGSNYPYQSLVNVNQPSIIGETSQLGAAITQWAVQGITWEESSQIDLGLDFGFFNNRLTGSFDYYIKNTDNILLELALPRSSGLDANFQNGAGIENKGWEFVLNWKHTVGDWSYYLTGQLDDNKNKVLDLLGTGPYIENDRILEEGTEFNALYGWASDGFLTKSDLEDPEVPKQESGTLNEGNLKFVDQDDNGVIDVNDRVVIGSEIPRMNYSFLGGVSWKGLSLNFILQGVGKRDGYIRKVGQSFGDNFYTWERDFYLSADHPIFTDHGYDQFGLEPNTDASQPAPGGDNGAFSDFWIKSRAYLRVKNVTLSYSLPQSLLNKLHIQNLRVYVSGDNLYTFHNFIKGFDPELTSGRGYWEYPNITKVMGGINLTF